MVSKLTSLMSRILELLEVLVLCELSWLAECGIHSTMGEWIGEPLFDKLLNPCLYPDIIYECQNNWLSWLGCLLQLQDFVIEFCGPDPCIEAN